MSRYIGEDHTKALEYCPGVAPSTDDVVVVSSSDATKATTQKVATNNIGALAVTTAKIAAGAVDSTKIGAGALDLTNAGLWTGKTLDNIGDGATYVRPAGVAVATHGITGTSFDTANPIDLSPIASTGIKSAGVPIHLGGKTLSGGSLLPYSYVMDVATTNSLLNPSFETNTTSWSVFDTAGVSTIARETGAGNFCVGVASAKVVTPANAGTHGIRHANIASVATDIWSFSAWVSNGATNAFCRVEFLDGGLAVLATTDGEKLSAIPIQQDVNGFTRLGITSTAPATTAWARFSVATTDVSTTFYIDGCQAEKGSQGYTTYCDGSMGTGYSWSGTANASTSSRLAGFHIVKPNDSYATWWDTIGIPHVLGLRVRSSNGNGPDPIDGELEVDVGTLVTISAATAKNPSGSNPGSMDIALVPSGPFGRLLLGSSSPAGAFAVRGAGTSLPASKSTNDVFFRTDLGALYYYDGSAWITVSPANQASFSAWLSTAGVTLVASTPKLLVLNNTEYNLGAHFSTSTGLFTAPVKGIYHFSGSWLTNAAGVDTVAYVAVLYKNGSEWKRGTAQAAGGTTTDIGSTVSADIQLAVTDTIGLYAISSGTPVVNPAQAFTWLMGHLVTVTP